MARIRLVQTKRRYPETYSVYVDRELYCHLRVEGYLLRAVHMDSTICHDTTQGWGELLACERVVQLNRACEAILLYHDDKRPIPIYDLEEMKS